jgi:hypothetical protein
MLLRAGQPFGAAAQQIAATVRSSEVIASDETSARGAEHAAVSADLACCVRVLCERSRRVRKPIHMIDKARW